jgi:acyl transferase domain-containing protein/thioesterase domain-containing protein/SAM-dependent methyltransferase
MSGEGLIAVVGMACRLPGASDVTELWVNLKAGRDTIARLDAEQLIEAGIAPELFSKPDYVRARGLLLGGEHFDSSYFGYNTADAASLDPQHRVFLESCSTALNDAAIDPARFDGLIGVFAGCDMTCCRLVEDEDYVRQAIGFEKDFLTSRVAYKLGLHGPAVTIQTACSTSLVAIHQACNSLHEYESDIALAGGASLWLPQTLGYRYVEGHILSRDGRCRPFDADASGTVPSNGVGVVVLRRLEDALRDGHRVLAVVRGSAINNDGGEKIGFTAPSIVGQRDAIRMALSRAGVEASDVGYVEAHGTGTRIGDPIEVAALTAAYRESTQNVGTCWLGAIKGNIGHTGAASGVAGFIKTVLQLHHREIVPTAHFVRPNPDLRLESTPFRVSDSRACWGHDGPLLAGISSFGIGGTNAHAILETAPRFSRSPLGARPRVFALSAATPSALGQYRDDIARALNDDDLCDAAFTLAVGRRDLPHRVAVVATDCVQLAQELQSAVPVAAKTSPSVAFVFPGQSMLRPGVGAQAYVMLPEFRLRFDEIRGLVQARCGLDLGDLLRNEAEAKVRDPAFQQLALLALGSALAEQLRQWGIRPSAMLGSSIGEYVAATLADVWSIEDAVAIVWARGQAIRACARGKMLATRPNAESPPKGVALAIAAPHQVVYSGSVERIEELDQFLGDQGIPRSVLEVEHAFHSPLLASAAGPLRSALESATFREPKCRYVSNVTGSWVHPEQIEDRDYWIRHLLDTVQLGEGLETLLSSQPDVVVELGPGDGMVQALRHHPRWTPETLATPSLGRSPSRERESLLAFIANLWAQGVNVDLPALLAEAGAQRCALPAPPLERKPCPPPASRARNVPRERLTGDGPMVVSCWTEVAEAVPLDDAVLLAEETAWPSIRSSTLSNADTVIALVDADVLPTKLDELAERVPGRLVIASRGVLAFLASESVRPELSAWVACRRRVGGDVDLFDLGDEELPRNLPLMGGKAPTEYVYRGKRWWRREARTIGDVCTARPPRVALITDDGARAHALAAQLAAAGVRVAAVLGGALSDHRPSAIDALSPSKAASATNWQAARARISHRPDLLRGLDRYAAGLIGKFCLEQGSPNPAKFDPEGRLPRFADFLVHELNEEGIVAELGGEPRFTPDAPERIERALAVRADLEDVAGVCRLLDHVAAALPAVFAGERAPVGVLWPDGSEEMLRSCLSENRVEVYDGLACLAALRQAVRAMHVPGKPMRILEVGGGHGGFTWPLIDEWADRSGVEYHFTDISTLLVRRAAARAEQRGLRGMRFSIFDVTRDPIEQGLAAGSFDLIVAYNVVHVAPSVHTALQRLRQLLTPSGLLSLIEVVEVTPWSHLLWGLAPGWWDFEDGERKRSIHLDRSTWLRVLTESGLPDVRIFPEVEPADHILLYAAPISNKSATHLEKCDWDVLLGVVGSKDSREVRTAASHWAEMVGEECAVVVSCDPSDTDTEIARSSLDPSGNTSAWTHLRTSSELGNPEIAALSAALRCSALPQVARLVGVDTRPECVGSNLGATLVAGAEARPVDAGSGHDPLTEIWCEELGLTTARENDDFFALGGESLAAVHLLARVQDLCGVTIAMSTFARHPTLRNLKALICDRTEHEMPVVSSTSPIPVAKQLTNVMVLREAQAGTPLFLSAAASGSSLCYRHLAPLLDDRPCYGLDSPGLYDGVLPYARLEDIAKHHIALIQSIQPHGPYLLGGWSFGAMVSHEIARQLSEVGEMTALILAIDGFLPYVAGFPVAFRPSWLARGVWFQLQASLGFGDAPRGIPQNSEERRGDIIHRIGEVRRQTRKSGKFVPDYVRVHNRSIIAMLRYRPRPVVAHVVVFKTAADPSRCLKLSAHLAPLYRNGVDVVSAPGDHWSVLDREHADPLASAIRTALAQTGLG